MSKVIQFSNGCSSETRVDMLMGIVPIVRKWPDLPKNVCFRRVKCHFPTAITLQKDLGKEHRVECIEYKSVPFSNDCISVTRQTIKKLNTWIERKWPNYVNTFYHGDSRCRSLKMPGTGWKLASNFYHTFQCTKMHFWRLSRQDIGLIFRVSCAPSLPIELFLSRKK